MVGNSVWVLAFDKSGNVATFTCCPKNNSRFYEEQYLAEGYDVRVCTTDEVDALISASAE